MADTVHSWLTSLGIQGDNAFILSQILILIALTLAGLILQLLINSIFRKENSIVSRFNVCIRMRIGS